MNLHGILLKPDSTPYADTNVGLTAIVTSPSVMLSVDTFFKTDASGAYSVDVPNGRYRVSLGKQPRLGYDIGTITITDDTTVDNINELLMIESTASQGDPILAQIGEVIEALEEVDAAVASATASASAASGSAAAAAASAASVLDISTVTPTADKIPIALPSGKLDEGWVDLSGYVPVESGKGLSSNDYTTEDKDKLGGVQSGATANPDTDSLAEGSVNRYFTGARSIASLLTGISFLTGAAVTAADSILIAIGKLQAQFYSRPSLTLYYVPSDGTDWAPAFNRAIAAGKMTVWVPRGDYGIGSTVFLPAGFFVDCDSRATTFYPKSGGTFVGGFMFQQNTTDGVTWTTPFPNMNSGGFRRCKFDNRENVPAARAIQTFASSRFEELTFNGFRQSISKPAGFYIDSPSVDDVICENPQDNTEYQISIIGLGDGVSIRGVHCPYTVATSQSVLAINLRGVNGGSIRDCIGGDYLIELCSAVSIPGGHFERAQHIYDSSNVSVPSIFLPDTRVPIITRGTLASANNESRFTLDTTNTIMETVEGLMEWTGFHIQLGTSCQLVTKNTCHQWTVQGDLQRIQRAGIRICQNDGITAIPSFNDLSYLTSKDAFVNIPFRVDLNHFIRCEESTFPGLSPAATRLEAIGTRPAGVKQWRIAIGPFFYTAQMIYSTSRAIGRNPTNAEISVNVPDDSKMVVLNTAFGTKPVSGIIRVSRGQATGVYDHFVDIHTIGTTWLHDNGLTLNGVPWVARTPGPVAAINSTGESIRFIGSLIEFQCGSLPNAAGTWTKADKVYRTDSTLDANNMLLFGHFRMTTGTGQAVPTDWVNMRVSHVSPAT